MAAMQIHYELYALRGDRWTLDACFPDEDEAREASDGMRRQLGVRGVRIVREMMLPAKDKPIVTVVYDTTGAAERSEIMAELRRAKEVTPVVQPQPEPDHIPRGHVHNATVDRSWLVWSGLALVLAALAGLSLLLN